MECCFLQRPVGATGSINLSKQICVHYVAINFVWVLSLQRKHSTPRSFCNTIIWWNICSTSARTAYLPFLNLINNPIKLLSKLGSFSNLRFNDVPSCLAATLRTTLFCLACWGLSLHGLVYNWLCQRFAYRCHLPALLHGHCWCIDWQSLYIFMLTVDLFWTFSLNERNGILLQNDCLKGMFYLLSKAIIQCDDYLFW